LFELNPDMHAVDFDGQASKLKAYRLGDMLPEAYKREWPKEEVGQLNVHVADPLAQAALEARQRSWAPRTGYPEGAAVQTEDGQIHKGCKVELSSFASQAERMAAASAFLRSGKKILRIALAGGKGQPETPRDINWDSLQALHQLNPEMRISTPGQDGQFRDQSLIEFSISCLK
jgi:cytidine deaminase